MLSQNKPEGLEIIITVPVSLILFYLKALISFSFAQNLNQMVCTRFHTNTERIVIHDISTYLTEVWRFKVKNTYLLNFSIIEHFG